MKPKNKINSVKFFVATLLLSLLASACGGGSPAASQRVSLVFWDAFENSQAMQPLIQAYEQMHPNVTVQYVQKTDVDTYPQDLLSALAAGNGPDIFSINNASLPQYISDITPAPTSTFTFVDFKNAFVDPVVNDFSLNQQVYGVAMSVDSLGLYYNKDILGSAGIAEPPQTWAQLSSDVQKIKRQDSTGYFSLSGVAMGSSSNVNRAVDILYLLMLQDGVQPYSGDGTPTFANEVEQNGNSANPGADALGFYTSFANPQSANYNWNARSDYSIDAFVNGRAAFLYSYYYTRATILQKSPDLNFDVAPVPQPNLTQPAVNFANYWGEVVSKQSKNSPWAWDFLKFITSQSSLTKYYAQTNEPSSRRDLIEQQIPDPNIGVFANANLTAKSFYRPNQPQMDGIFGQAIDNVNLNGMSPQDAITQAQQQAEALGNP